MEKQNQAQREAVTELYRREADKLSALVQEAEELLQEGQMLYREGVVRKAEVQRERVNTIKEVAGIFGIDPEKSGKRKGA